MPDTHPLLFSLLLSLSLSLSAAEPTQDKAALLTFINNLPHSPRIAWNTSSSACDWVGVRCDATRTAVQFLRLPCRGLLGPIPPSTLSRLTTLRVLSLHSNALSGPIPPDLANLPLLRSLYLHNNLLSGALHPSLSRLPNLSRLDLSGNVLSGEIPPTFSNLTRLTKLFLQNNKFSGGITRFVLPELVAFNVSNNRLNGSIPPELRGFPASSFAANQGLCGIPLSPCPLPKLPPPQETPSDTEELSPPLPRPRKKKKLSTVAIVAIWAGSGGVLLLAILLLLIFWAIRRGGRRARRRKPQANGAAAAAAGGSEAPRSAELSSSLSKEEGEGSGDAGERSRLVFVGGRGGVEGGAGGRGYSFDLEDLLRASAEVLGKGISGTSYMAVLEEGMTVVVKRLKDIDASRREFEQRMDALGRIVHPNLHPIRAYYYSDDEKLLVSDFLAAGSLSALLHGGRRSGRTSLDWDSRVRIAVAAGRGLAHLHDVAKVVHGDVRSSNVLLNREPESAVLSDYGLSELHGPPVRAAAGYRAPEAGRGTYKTDVYGLGVVVLELLTGKEANQAGLGGEEGIVDLARWVKSVVREEWTAEVFDVELIRYPNIEEEMVKLLQVAMACVADRPEDRPEVREAVRMMEEIVRPPPDEGSGGPALRRSRHREKG